MESERAAATADKVWSYSTTSIEQPALSSGNWDQAARGRRGGIVERLERPACLGPCARLLCRRSGRSCNHSVSNMLPAAPPISTVELQSNVQTQICRHCPARRVNFRSESNRLSKPAQLQSYPPRNVPVSTGQIPVDGSRST